MQPTGFLTAEVRHTRGRARPTFGGGNGYGRGCSPGQQPTPLRCPRAGGGCDPAGRGCGRSTRAARSCRQGKGVGQRPPAAAAASCCPLGENPRLGD